MAKKGSSHYSVDVEPGEKVTISKTKRKTRKRKKSTKKRKSSRRSTTKKRDTLEEQLIENLVELQKVHTNLATKYDKLSSEISNLLALFEMTAKNFAKQVPVGEFEKDKAFLDKIDKLLDQNKTIAKGLTLMEEKLRERVYGEEKDKKEAKKETTPSQVQEEEPLQPSINSRDRPLPRF